MILITTAIYYENGWEAKVEILEDHTDDVWEKYKLKVIRTINESPIFKTPEDGHIFEPCAKWDYRHFVDWEMKNFEEDNIND